MPSPTQTVVVNLPPEVIEKLAPHTGIDLTQPWATVIAAFIALGAAFLALRNIKIQVQADAAIARANREAEEDRAHLEERVRLLAEALNHGSNIFQIAVGWAEEWDERNEISFETNRRYQENLARAQFAYDMLLVRGLTDSAEALSAYLQECEKVRMNEIKADSEEMQVTREHMLSTFRRSAERPHTRSD